MPCLLGFSPSCDMQPCRLSPLCILRRPPHPCPAFQCEIGRFRPVSACSGLQLVPRECGGGTLGRALPWAPAAHRPGGGTCPTLLVFVCLCGAAHQKPDPVLMVNLCLSIYFQKVFKGSVGHVRHVMGGGAGGCWCSCFCQQYLLSQSSAVYFAPDSPLG